MVWHRIYANYKDNFGRYIRRFPVDPRLHLTVPGRGESPPFCGRSKVLGFGANDGSIVTGFTRCNEAKCPDCARGWVFTMTHRGLSYLLAAKAAHPCSHIYAAVFRPRCGGVLSPEDLQSYRAKLNRFLSSIPGVRGYLPILHDFRVKHFVKKAILDFEERDLSDQELYEKVTDLGYLRAIGFNFKHWRQAVEPFYHWHVFIVADSCPDLYIHGNGKNSISRNFFANNYYPSWRALSVCPSDNPLSGIGTTRHSSSFSTSRITPVDPAELLGNDLVRHLRYCFGHATISNVSGLVLRTLNPVGACRRPIDFNSDGSDGSGPSDIPSRAFEMLKKLYKVTWRGVRVYPSWDAPLFNEDLPATDPGSGFDNVIPASFFDIPYKIENGKKVIDYEFADYVLQRARSYILDVRILELTDAIPHAGFSPSAVIKHAIDLRNEKRLSSTVRARDVGAFTSEIPDFDKHAAAGLVVDLGRVSKGTFFNFGGRQNESDGAGMSSDRDSSNFKQSTWSSF